MALCACLLALLPADASEGPGRIGVYLRLQSLAGDPDALRRELRDVRKCGVDFIVPIAKDTSGRVYWDSRIAPSELVASRTFLADITKMAHVEGLKVYPWVCVCTEGGLTAVNRVLKDHPDWATITAEGSIGIIDPGNPAARKYETRLIAEMVDTVEVDGVSLDYVRASNRFAYTPTLRRDFLEMHGTDARDILGLGAAPVGSESGGATGEKRKTSPREHPLWPEWREWYRGNLDLLMREIAVSVRRARPGATIGSYVWGAHTYGPTFETYQDWKSWIAEGWLDWINPSGYRYTEESFVEAARLNRASVPQSCPMLITIGVRTSHGSLTAEQVKRQMELASRDGAQGLVFFTWEALKPFTPALAEDIRTWKPAPSAFAPGGPTPGDQ